LSNGGLVAIPTDTVYGVAALAFQEEAVSRVYAAKGRSLTAAVPVLIGTAAELPALVESVPDSAWPLIDVFWPGALTLVLPARRGAPPWITRGGPTIGVRIPANRRCLELLQLVNEPLVGTSANRSGQPPARTAEQVGAQLAGYIDAVLEDDRSDLSGRASTVLEIREGEGTLHRQGSVSLQDLRTIFPGPIRIPQH
jgi:L-threonylcarbamoyladenylate synthase